MDSKSGGPLLTITGQVGRAPRAHGRIAACILPDQPNGRAAAFYLIANDGIGQELGLFLGDRLTITGRLLRRRPTRNTLRVTSYGYFNHARP